MRRKTRVMSFLSAIGQSLIVVVLVLIIFRVPADPSVREFLAEALSVFYGITVVWAAVTKRPVYLGPAVITPSDPKGLRVFALILGLCMIAVGIYLFAT